MFRPHLFAATPAHERLYGIYERIYTCIDVTAAWCFVIGSVMFFSEDWLTPGTWLFLVGSLCFAAKPTVRFLREYHLASLPLPEDEAPSTSRDAGTADAGKADAGKADAGNLGADGAVPR
ncbi:MAG: YrhK family protein [Pseudomonadota bacterium]